VIFTPRTHSEITGNTVPQKTANAMPTSTRLLNRNAASREKNDSIVPAVRSSGSRYTTSPPATRIAKQRKPMKNGPRPDCVNECTDEMTPLRVRNVPKMVSVNVRSTRTMFQTRSMSFFSWIMTEWRNAVDTSHGMNAAFSTGSHAQ